MTHGKNQKIYLPILDETEVEKLQGAFDTLPKIAFKGKGDYATILVAANLNLELLKRIASNQQYCDAVLEKAGVTDMGDRVRIITHPEIARLDI